MLGLLGVSRHAHLKIHLLLQGFAIELVEERGLVVLVHVLNLLDVLS